MSTWSGTAVALQLRPPRHHTVHISVADLSRPSPDALSHRRPLTPPRARAAPAQTATGSGTARAVDGRRCGPDTLRRTPSGWASRYSTNIPTDESASRGKVHHHVIACPMADRDRQRLRLKRVRVRALLQPRPVRRMVEQSLLALAAGARLLASTLLRPPGRHAAGLPTRAEQAVQAPLHFFIDDGAGDGGVRHRRLGVPRLLPRRALMDETTPIHDVPVAGWTTPAWTSRTTSPTWPSGASRRPQASPSPASTTTPARGCRPCAWP